MCQFLISNSTKGWHDATSWWFIRPLCELEVKISFPPICQIHFCSFSLMFDLNYKEKKRHQIRPRKVKWPHEALLEDNGNKGGPTKGPAPPPQCLHKESLQRKYSWSHTNEEWQLEQVNISHFRGNLFVCLNRFISYYMWSYKKVSNNNFRPFQVSLSWPRDFPPKINLQRFLWRSFFPPPFSYIFWQLNANARRQRQINWAGRLEKHKIFKWWNNHRPTDSIYWGVSFYFISFWI